MKLVIRHTEIPCEGPIMTLVVPCTVIMILGGLSGIAFLVMGGVAWVIGDPLSFAFIWKGAVPGLAAGAMIIYGHERGIPYPALVQTTAPRRWHWRQEQFDEDLLTCIFLALLGLLLIVGIGTAAAQAFWGKEAIAIGIRIATCIFFTMVFTTVCMFIVPDFKFPWPTRTPLQQANDDEPLDALSDEDHALNKEIAHWWAVNHRLDEELAQAQGRVYLDIDHFIRALEEEERKQATVEKEKVKAVKPVPGCPYRLYEGMASVSFFKDLNSILKDLHQRTAHLENTVELCRGKRI